MKEANSNSVARLSDLLSELVLTCKFVDKIINKVRPTKRKQLGSTFLSKCCLLYMLHKVDLKFE